VGSSSTPVVSTIVPMFQAEEHLAEALDSALGQTVADIEVIVVDDGSTDGGPGIAQAYAERDSRVRYLRQENGGVARARNAGLRLARAQYVAFLDSDDVWLPPKLERQLAAAFDGVLYSDAYLLVEGEAGDRRISDAVEPASGAILERLLDENVVPLTTAFFPTALARRFGGFDEQLRSVEDLDLWLRMAAAGIEFRHMAEPLARYRVHPGSLSSDPVSMSYNRVAVFEKVESALQGASRRSAHRRVRTERHLLAGELRQRAWELLADRRTSEARGDLRSALAASPSVAGVVTVAASFAPPLLKALAARVSRA
jgi:glycosyltransferase involved in cell wall biosynthesis